MFHRIFLLLISSVFLAGAVLIESVHAQDSDSGEQAEATEDAYRKRMELKDARDKNTFTNSTYTTQVKQQKIDKLPKESRDNIRAQLTDIIIENGQWEPSDILNENPYSPTEAAEGDPALREQEEEAWAEQLEKYHQREAAAFGASRPPMPGSNSQQAAGSPEGGGQQGQEQDGQSDSQDGSQGEGEQQGKEKNGQGEAGQQDGQGENGSPDSAGSYDPYQSQQNDKPDEISTAGVSESALDFLKAQQGQSPGNPGQMSPGEEDAQQEEEQATPQQASLSQAESNAAESPPDSQDSQQQSVTEPIIPGTIAIKDLDKLEGLEDENEEPDNP
jgi:hypothetical protein